MVTYSTQYVTDESTPIMPDVLNSTTDSYVEVITGVISTLQQGFTDNTVRSKVLLPRRAGLWISTL